MAGANTARPELALSGRRCCRWCRWPKIGMDGIRQFIAAEVFASGSAHLRHSYEWFAVVVPSIPKQESNPALFLRGLYLDFIVFMRIVFRSPTSGLQSREDLISA